jgi:glycosyltransferase involved in cell wall biosynthesis
VKIGIDIRTVGKNRTGDETYTRELVKNLLNIDSENEYFLYTDTDDPAALGRIEEIFEIGKKANARIVPILPASKTLWTFWLLPKHIKNNPVDILHVQYITPWLLPKKTSLITTIHDVSFNKFPGLIKKTDLFFLRTLIPFSLRRADKIIAVSHFTKDEIKKYYKINGKKIEMVYNGGVSEEYLKRYSPEEIEKIKNKYKISGKFLLYIGTFQPRKNIPFLIDAFGALKDKKQRNDGVNNLKLVLVGNKDGRNFDRNIDLVLKKNNQFKKNIIFTGYAEGQDLPILHQGAEVFCFPSLYEGFGLPLIEAMASGTPVVCSDSSCNKEIVGDGALFYEENNKKDFVKKMELVLSGGIEREKLVAAGKIRAGKYSWKNCAKQTLDLYLSLVDLKII